MTQYVIRRCLQAIPLLFLVNVFIFILLKAAGDPFAYLALDPTVSEADRAYLSRSLGLDDPMYMQFIHWYIGDDWYMRDLDFDGEVDTPGRRAGILRGDWGQSIRFSRPVQEVIAQRLPNTLILGGSALLVTVIAGVSIGVFAALRPYSWLDNIITTLSFLTFSMPIFLVALLSVLVFSITLENLGLPHLPTQGMYDPRGDRSIDELLIRLILPTMSIAAISTARYARFMRGSMLEVINADYIRTARAKGLKNRRITWLHALKNASIPLVTLISLDIPFILSGAVVTETIFSWPGMGRLFIESLNILDPPVLLIFTLLVAVGVVIFQVVADILYAWVDPRIRFN
ncbi:MAG: ABC transporter permease [Anaerolineae bacterium]